MSITVRTSESGPSTSNQATVAQLAGAHAQNEEQKSAPASNEKSEQNESSESDTEEAEAREAKDDTSDESESGENEGKEDDAEKDKPKKKGGFQRRIDKLNAKKAEVERERDYWRNAALKGAGESNADKVEKVETKKADETGKPRADDFDNHSDYLEALTDWKVEQREKAREAKHTQDQLKTEHQRMMDSHFDREKSFAAKTPDYNETIAEMADIPVSAAVTEAVVTSENGPALLYELAKNPDELERINKLHPIAAARELGKLESRLAQASGERKPETKKTTSAPKPLDPVGTGGKGSIPKSISDPNLSQAEYERLRREEMKKRRA
jgi:hypothetical protein